MVSYFYKNKYKETTSFISCTWMNGIDFKTSSINLSTPICQLVVTNVHDFYKGTVTYRDLDDFTRSNISLDVLNKLIEVALQGGEEYDGDRIVWKTIFSGDSCQMTLLGYWNNTLPIQVGTLHLDRVTDSEKLQVWTEWMEMEASQFKALKETQDALLLRNHSLEQDFNKMKVVAEDLTFQKTAADQALMGKFKELLNEKKRKIRQLELKCKRKDTRRGLIEENNANPSFVTQSLPPSASAPSSSTPSTKTATKRKNLISTRQQVSPSSTIIKRQRTASAEPSTMNDATPPPPPAAVVSPVTPPASSKNPTGEGHSDGDVDDEGIGKVPLLTTTRSRYRKLINPRTALQTKPDPDSSTTEDEDNSD